MLLGIKKLHSGTGAAAGYLADIETQRASGEYYAGRDGTAVERPGQWLGALLTSLGVTGRVTLDRLLHWFDRRHPLTGKRLVPCKPGHIAAYDYTFSAPKSVSAIWAVADDETRGKIEKAQDAAVVEALDYITRHFHLARKGRAKVTDTAAEVGAAMFLHTVSRQSKQAALRSLPPDPDVHTHVPIGMVRRHDGELAAVYERQLYHRKREAEAVYHAALAIRLAEMGFEIERMTGTRQRYFEVAGVPQALREDWSSRKREIAANRPEWVAAFRDKHDRDPTEQELRGIAARYRVAKAKLTRNPREHWRLVGRERGFHRDTVDAMRHGGVPEVHRASAELIRELLGADGLTREQACFTLPMLATEAMARGTGRLSVADIERTVERLLAHEDVVELGDRMWTTQQMLAMEQDVLAWRTSRADLGHQRWPGGQHIWHAIRAGQKAGITFDAEQQSALRTMVIDRTVVVTGAAGSGKGAVLSAAADVWRRQGRRVLATAVAGATAQRLGQALGEDQRALTMDALIRRLELHVVEPRRDDVFVVDEAGMVSTRQWHRLTQALGDQATVVMVGDHAQLSPIPAGGLWPQLSTDGMRLTQVYRTKLEWQREAWSLLREGRAEEALSAYAGRGQLTVCERRADALTAAVEAWDRDGRGGQIITDSSNAERHAANQQAQRKRLDAGELGAECVMATCTEGEYGLHTGDRVMFRSQVRTSGKRIENGTTGQIAGVDPAAGTVTVKTNEPEPREIVVDPTEAKLLLGYGVHIMPAQGMTAEIAYVVAGGFQTTRNSLYTCLSRSRQGAHLFVDRETLGQGMDAAALAELAKRATKDGAKRAAVSHLKGRGRASTRRAPKQPLADRYHTARQRRDAAERARAQREYRPLAPKAAPTPEPELTR